MNDINETMILTFEGRNKLKEELRHLVTIERPIIIAKIKDAREQGDLSENAEFEAARERQGQIEDKISEIENVLANSKVINIESADTKKVVIGSTVTYKRLDKKKTYTYQIVGTIEADTNANKISNITPLAMALLNKVEGDEATVRSINEYRIIIKKIA